VERVNAFIAKGEKMRELRTARRVGLLLSLALSVGVALGFVIGRGQSSVAGSGPDFQLMTEAWNLIRAHYVDRKAVKPGPLTHGAIAGMVRALGDTGHSVFLTPDMRRMERRFVRGKLVGIGVEVQMKHGHLVVVAPIDGTPAARAGLSPGDLILKVDGENISGMSLVQSIERIEGPTGSTVSLTVSGGGRTRQVRLKRTSIKVRSVTWARVPGTRVADLRIASFNDGVTASLRRALEALHKEPPDGVILDLRNNPGGELAEAIGVASQFLSGGNVLLVKDARGKETPVPVTKGGLATSVPLVALVNSGTASAAEIVAGALQAARRARLVGQTTFATGTVLQSFPLSDGSALMLATEEWLTPDGKTIWHRGIKPDVVLALASDARPVVPRDLRKHTLLHGVTDSQLLRALALLEAGQSGDSERSARRNGDGR